MNHATLFSLTLKYVCPFSQTLSLLCILGSWLPGLPLLSGYPSTITIPQPQRPQQSQWELGQTQT